ncbi:hypothetical protein [Acidovorax radicis]|uniref:hypothetical protein n=1 Tax=Acidovorax radicis TaxID=758826 RepID=UPI001CF80DA4|nr:hypothetical protein [Acidovorax radicis]UCU98560.1 hypothetical protein KI609_18980 [Acidovorax radicis]
MPDAWLQDVALVVQQHEERACVPALVALQQRLPAGVPVVTFPSFFLPCLWPFECVDTRNNTPERHPERAEAPYRALQRSRQWQCVLRLRDRIPCSGSG